MVVCVVAALNRGREPGHAVYELDVDGDLLRWRTPLGSDVAPLTTVVVVRRARLTRRLPVIELAGRRPLTVRVRPGLRELLNVMLAVPPDLPVRMERPALVEGATRSFFVGAR